MINSGDKRIKKKESEDGAINIQIPVEVRLQLKALAGIKRISMRQAVVDYLSRGIITDYKALNMLPMMQEKAREIAKYIVSSE